MTTTYRHSRRTLSPSGLWSALVVLGVAVSVLGLLLVMNPFTTAGALAVLTGVALLVAGIGEIVSAARAENAASAVLFGVLMAAAGVVILLWPGLTLRAIALVAGAALIVGGVVRVLLLLASRPRGSGTVARGLVVAALAVVLGVLALAWPAATVAVLAVLFGIQLIVTGVTEVALGLALRPQAARR